MTFITFLKIVLTDFYFQFKEHGMSHNTSITLIRHGETEWNLSGRWQGHADSPLSPRGVAQAEALGQRMKGEQFDFYYSSDLGRAMHTSELVGGPIGYDCRAV